MKKSFLPLFGTVLLMLAGLAVTPTVVAGIYKQVWNQDWEKSKTGTWVGKKDGKTYWYKLDRNAQLWWSADGKKWAAVEGGMWADKDNRWIKIGDGKLWWTIDAGKNFSEVPEWKWEAPDGKWYKFDAKWTLWVNR